MVKRDQLKIRKALPAAVMEGEGGVRGILGFNKHPVVEASVLGIFKHAAAGKTVSGLARRLESHGTARSLPDAVFWLSTETGNFRHSSSPSVGTEDLDLDFTSVVRGCFGLLLGRRIIILIGSEVESPTFQSFIMSIFIVDAVIERLSGLVQGSHTLTGRSAVGISSPGCDMTTVHGEFEEVKIVVRGQSLNSPSDPESCSCGIDQYLFMNSKQELVECSMKLIAPGAGK